MTPSVCAVVRYGMYLYVYAHELDVTVPVPVVLTSLPVRMADARPTALATVAISLGSRVGGSDT